MLVQFFNPIGISNPNPGIKEMKPELLTTQIFRICPPLARTHNYMPDVIVT